MKCRACFGTNLKPFVDLGPQPASNDFRALAVAEYQYIYELAVMVCEDCGLGQTSVDLSPGTVFPPDYAYYSSQSPTWVEDRKQFAHRMINELSLGAGSLVVDVGSNDGYFLKHFLGEDRKISVEGWEPAANVAEVARAAGVPTYVDFWGASKHATGADLVNATNVLAHTPDMDGFIAGIAASLSIRGTATIEFPLFSNLIRNNQLDTIYHEHYSYLSLRALDNVLARHGLRMWRVETLETHGGSVRVFACKEKARFLEEESPRQVKATEIWAPDIDFESKAQKVKWDLLEFLVEARKDGLIVGYGAPAKATVLCNYVGLNKDIIDFTVDDSPYKQGKFVPGTNIPIFPSENLKLISPPAYILLFAWNLMEPIREKLRGQYRDSVRYIGDKLPRIVTAIPKLTITNL